MDDILQEMVVNSPLNEKDIHLMDDPQKGMKIWIGNSSYDDIEDISDSDVRELIKGAVAEWESRAEKD